MESKDVWEKYRSWECLSSEDKLTWIKGVDSHLLGKVNGALKTFDIESGQICGGIEIGTDQDPVLAVAAVQPAQEDACWIAFTGHKSGLIRRWSGSSLTTKLQEPEPTSLFKSDHKSPILHLCAGNEAILVSVGADFVNKVWDVEKRHLVGILRGITAVAVCNDIVVSTKAAVMASGLADGNVKVWKINLPSQTANEEDIGISVDPTPITLTKHNSQIASVAVFDDGSKVAAFGRDQLMSVWEVESQTCLHLVPTYEELERALVLDQAIVEQVIEGEFSKDRFCLAAGEKGQVRLWNVTQGIEVNAKKFCDHSNITGKVHDMHVTTSGSIFTVRDDLVIKTKIGGSSSEDVDEIFPLNQSEVLDFTLASNNRLVIATNNAHMRVYHFDSGHMTVAHSPSGHTDAVLAVAALNPLLDKVPETTEDHFVSCGKDQSVCLWKFKGNVVQLVGKGTGHVSYVGAVALSTSLLFSASKDGILKSWSFPSESDEEVVSLKTKRTVAAHQQEVNSLDVSFDGEILVTGSQDKTAKVWRASDLGLLGTLSGHRRGVWSTKFILDGNRLLISTASADATVKLWEKNSFGTFVCVQTLEGHLASVLSVTSLIPVERKLATVSSDGLLKVWNLDNSASATNDAGSFEAHDDKVWALEFISTTGTLVTGGRDGQMAFWRNVTDKVRAEEKAKTEETIKTDQKLSNYIQKGQLVKALKICLRTGKPRMARETLASLRKKDQLKEALTQLSTEEKNYLHGLLVKWNSYGTQCALAQDALKVLIVDAMVHDQKMSAAQCAGLIAFSEKHYQRLNKLHSKLAVVDLLLDNM